MTVHMVTLDRLREIARRSNLQYAVDATRGIAYLRVAQTKYVAPMAEANAA